MINLKEHSMIGDEVALYYDGPGYYSSKTKQALSEPLSLIKVGEEYIDKEDMYQFCKNNGFTVKPYKIDCCSDVPDHWEVMNCSDIEELEDNY